MASNVAVDPDCSALSRAYGPPVTSASKITKCLCVKFEKCKEPT
jgi:hypothetical protein